MTGEATTTVAIDSEAAAADTKNSAVGFLIFDKRGDNPTPAGTGTLARLGANFGIITAGHVIRNLPKAGKVGLVRFPSSGPKLQNQKIEMEHTDSAVIWDGTEGSAPDIGFLRMPSASASYVEAVGGVFYNLEKVRSFAPSSPMYKVARCYAIVGVIAEWAGDLPGERPKTLIKDVHGLFGASEIVKAHIENGVHLLDCKVQYHPDARVPQSYEGVSGGALWELNAELQEKTIISIKKKLHGIAFRQSEVRDGHRLVVCQGPQEIEGLTDEMKKLWPETSSQATPLASK